MAPKKQQQKPKKPSSSSGPRLQISAENENRLRRLLLNSGQTTAPVLADETLSIAQKSKRLRSIYEKLSCEGFANEQIELALSALKAMFYNIFHNVLTDFMFEMIESVGLVIRMVPHLKVLLTGYALIFRVVSCHSSFLVGLHHITIQVCHQSSGGAGEGTLKC